jgi:hypothetical protein
MRPSVGQDTGRETLEDAEITNKLTNADRNVSVKSYRKSLLEAVGCNCGRAPH